MSKRGTITKAGSRRTGIPAGTRVICYDIRNGVAEKITSVSGASLGGCVSVTGPTKGIDLDP